MLCPVSGGPPRPIPGLTGYFAPAQWSEDGRSIYVFRLGPAPTAVQKVDIDSGRVTVWKNLTPPDVAGVTTRAVAMTPDAKYYAYSCQQYLTTLYLVEGVSAWRRQTLWSRLLGGQR